MSEIIITKIPGDRRITTQITLEKTEYGTEPLFDLIQDDEIVEFTATQLRDLRKTLEDGYQKGELP